LRGNEDRAGSPRLARENHLATDKHVDLLDELTNFAEERNISMLQLAMAWLLANPGVAAAIRVPPN
jgi:aryl-alcohol dehydrogenase-like predicted oxidoreductase